MKLTGELKDKVEAAETMEEKKDIIEKAGMALNDDELDEVTGGFYGVQARGAASKVTKII